MNANELADWLIAYMVDDDDYEEKYMEQIVTMLRQQQAEIADKKLVNDTFSDLIKKQGKKIDNQQAEIEALKDALRMKVILNEHAQHAMRGYKELLK